MSRPVLAAAERTPDALAVDDGNGRRWSYAALAAWVESGAARLGQEGIETGDVVMLCMAPGPAQVAALHALWLRGAVVAPIHPRSAPAELAAAVQMLTPSAAVVDDTYHAYPGDRMPVVDAGELGVSDPSDPREGPTTWSEGTSVAEPAGGVAGGAEGDAEGGAEGGAQGGAAGSVPRGALEVPIAAPDGGRAAIVMTSGTSGAASGVAIGWAALRFNARASRERLGLEASDRWYASLSVAHVGGLALLARAALLGSAVVAPGAFSVDEFLRLARAGRITHASLVPVMLRRILEAAGEGSAPSALRALLIGGGACPPALLERALTRGYPVCPTYGLSEASSQVATATVTETRVDATTVGRPLDGVELRIDERGEILVRGPLLAEARVGTDRGLTDGEGWLHTGDLGRLDDTGRLRVLGRRDDRLITGGLNVDPVEVEGELRRLPFVADACVVGLDDATWGHRIVALLVRAERAPTGSLESAASSDLSDRIRTALAGRLRPEKTPRSCHWVASLPRNRNGKVDRRAARDVAASRERGTASAS